MIYILKDLNRVFSLFLLDLICHREKVSRGTNWEVHSIAPHISKRERGWRERKRVEPTSKIKQAKIIKSIE